MDAGQTRSLKPPRPRRRGRPTLLQEQAITDAIVLTALRLFLRDGYFATSMKRIGETARVSPGTLYARFPDKPSLFAAAVQRQAEMWRPIRPPLPRASSKPLVEVLQAGALGIIEFLDRPDVTAFNRILALETERFPELARIYGAHANVVGVDWLSERIMATPEGRAFSNAEATEVASTLMESVIGWSQMRRFQSEPRNPVAQQKAARRIARIISRGVLAGPG